jgi:hypothetical protein
MKTFKLRFEEEVKYAHEIIIETELSNDELNELLDEIDFSDSNLDDGVCLLEENNNITIKEVIESDPCEWGMECTDYTEVKK